MSFARESGRHVPPAPCHGMLRDAEPVGRRQRAVLEQLGFQALATRAPAGWSFGLGDTQVTLDAGTGASPARGDAVAVPVNADFRDGLRRRAGRGGDQRGHGRRHGDRRALHRGLLGDDADPLLDFNLSVDAWMRPDAPSTRAARPSSSPALRRLRLRTSGHRRDHPSAPGYADAGATASTLPASTTWSTVGDRGRSGAQAGEPADQRTVHDRRRGARLGVRRISVGGTLARTASTGS